MAEFFCMENGNLLDRTLLSQVDRTLVTDSRVLDNLLNRENVRSPSLDYFERVQKEVKPTMRKVVASWMLEVCEDQRCENAVFPMAMNYFDRFLSLTNVQKKHLQLLGGVCLLMASKFRQTRSISVDNIVDYTDFSVTREDILNWELLVLSKLNWDMSATIPDDFVDQLLNRLHIEGRDAEKVRKHAAIFISLCSTEHNFLEYSPSILASACIACSAHGLSTQIQQHWSSLSDLLKKLHQITQRPLERIETCYDKVEALVREKMAPVEQQFQSSYNPERSVVNATNKSSQMDMGNEMSPIQPETPTDVQDVNF